MTGLPSATSVSEDVAEDIVKDKIARFVERYGYNLRGFALSALLFPPAAVFIALKHPTWSKPQRAFSLVCLVGFLAVLPIVGTAVFAALYKLGASLFAG